MELEGAIERRCHSRELTKGFRDSFIAPLALKYHRPGYPMRCSVGVSIQALYLVSASSTFRRGAGGGRRGACGTSDGRIGGGCSNDAYGDKGPGCDGGGSHDGDAGWKKWKRIDGCFLNRRKMLTKVTSLFQWLAEFAWWCKETLWLWWLLSVFTHPSCFSNRFFSFFSFIQYFTILFKADP